MNIFVRLLSVVFVVACMTIGQQAKAAYSYIGGFTYNGNTSNTFTVTVPSGPCVVEIYLEKAVSSAAVVTANATALTQAPNPLFSSGNYLFSTFYGACPSTTSITVTGGAAFSDITIAVWSWSSGQTLVYSNGAVGSNITPSVNSGDYLFAIQLGNSNWTNSTQTPGNIGPGTPYLIVGNDHDVTVADWTASATGTFTITNSSGFGTFYASDFTPGATVTAHNLLLLGVGQ